MIATVLQITSKKIGKISSHSNSIVLQIVFALFTKLVLPTLFLLRYEKKM